MTTTISLATNNCIVLGCDSLGTVSLPSIGSYQLYSKFFEGDGTPKLDADGKPIALTTDMILEMSRSVPANQIPSVTKIFPLDDNSKGTKDRVDAALLFAGLATVGNKSLKNVIAEFIGSAPFKEWKKKSRTIEALAKILATHINTEFVSADEYAAMEIIVSGYSKDCREPEIRKVNIARGLAPQIEEENKQGEYKIVYGGQFDVVQRVVEGIDVQGWNAIGEQIEIALTNFRDMIVAHVAANGYTATIPTVADAGGPFKLVAFPFKFGTLSSEVRHFSEQAGINFVEFLVELMEKAQQFSDRIPTVGGDIHIGLITAGEGFRWITREDYKSRDHSVPKHKED